VAGDVRLISALLGLLIGVLSLVMIGEVIFRLLRFDHRDFSCMESLVVAFGLGNGAAVLELFFFILGNLPLTCWALMIPWLLAGGSLLYGWWSRRQRLAVGRLPASSVVSGFSSPSGQEGPWAWWELFLVLALALGMLDTFITTATTPFPTSDAIAFWAPKAKLFYEHRFAPFAAVYDLQEFPHPDYPLFLPLTEVWLFLWMGQMNEYLMKFLFPVYTVFLVLSTWAIISRLAGRRSALLAAGLLATTPFVLLHGTIGYADLLLALYYWLATAWLCVWMQTPQYPFLLLGAIFLGLTGWIKNEGLPLMLLNGCALVAYLLARRRSGRVRTLRTALLFSGAAMVFLPPWFFLQHSLGLESDLSIPPLANLPSQALQRFWPIAKAFGRELFAPVAIFTKWNLAWYLLALVVVFYNRNIWQSWLRYPALLMAGQVMVYVGVYIITPYKVDWHMATSLDRLFLHFYPLALLLLVCGPIPYPHSTGPRQSPGACSHGASAA